MGGQGQECHVSLLARCSSSRISYANVTQLERQRCRRMLGRLWTCEPACTYSKQHQQHAALAALQYPSSHSKRCVHTGLASKHACRSLAVQNRFGTFTRPQRPPHPTHTSTASMCSLRKPRCCKMQLHAIQPFSSSCSTTRVPALLQACCYCNCYCCRSSRSSQSQLRACCTMCPLCLLSRTSRTPAWGGCGRV